MIERTAWKLLSLLSSTFLARRAKQLCISEGTVEISTTIKGLKDAAVEVPIIFPLNSPIWILSNKNK